MEVANRTPTELSNDINVITAEINAYQRVAGEAIFEIGKRLKHVKENDLAHGEFGKWLEDIGLNKRTAQMMMKVVDEFEEQKACTYTHLGIRALYEIATMQPEEREIEHELVEVKEINNKKVAVPTGKFKLCKDMTVKELHNVKKVLEGKIEVLTNENKSLVADKESLINENDRLENQVDELIDSNYILQDKLDSVQPEIIEVPVERVVVEKDTSLVTKISELERKLKRAKEELKYAQMDADAYKTAYDNLSELEKAKEETREEYQKRSNSNKVVSIKMMLSEMAKVANTYHYLTTDAKLIGQLVNNDSECADNWNSIAKFLEALEKNIDVSKSNIIDMEV